MGVTAARAVSSALAESGVTVCFANPGTSELDLVAALETTPGMRTVLCLHETVATGAADGYARLAGRPAATALHQGPGLANGLANLHNARKARSPIVNVVGVSGEAHLDGPLDSAPETLAQPVSKWVRTISPGECASCCTRSAVAAATGDPRGVATLLVPESVMWSPAADAPCHDDVVPPISSASVEAARRALASEASVTIVLGATLLNEAALHAAARLAQAYGARLLTVAFPTVLARGAGVPSVEPLERDPAAARRQLRDASTVILVDTDPPVAAFENPGHSRRLTPEATTAIRLHTQPWAAADLFAELLDAAPVPFSDNSRKPMSSAAFKRVHLTAARSGPLAAQTVGLVLAALLPEGAVLIDESNSSSPAVLKATGSAAAHLLLTVPGFAIGGALPLSVGAAIADPHRRVICVVADGSAMFSLPALWTQARENLNCLTVVLNNRRYQILLDQIRRRFDVDSADYSALTSSRLFDLTHPDIDFVSLAQGLGVPAGRARTVADLEFHVKKGLTTHGPYVVEAVLDGR